MNNANPRKDIIYSGLCFWPDIGDKRSLGSVLPFRWQMVVSLISSVFLPAMQCWYLFLERKYSEESRIHSVVLRWICFCWSLLEGTINCGIYADRAWPKRELTYFHTQANWRIELRPTEDDIYFWQEYTAKKTVSTQQCCNAVDNCDIPYTHWELYRMINE